MLNLKVSKLWTYMPLPVQELRNSKWTGCNKWFCWTYNIDIVILDGKKRKNNAPINRISEHNCPSIHLWHIKESKHINDLLCMHADTRKAEILFTTCLIVFRTSKLTNCRVNFLNIKSNHVRSTTNLLTADNFKHCWLKLSISFRCYPITMQLPIQWFLANKLPGTRLQRRNLECLQPGIHDFFPGDLKLF